MPGFFSTGTSSNDDIVHRPLDFVVDPRKVFKPEWGGNDFNSDAWKETLSTDGLLRVSVRCDYKSMGGLQGTMAMAIPPSLVDEMDMWEASRPAGVWDFHSFLAFIQLPDPQDFVIRLFVSHDSFYDEIYYETVLEAEFRPDLSTEEDTRLEGAEPENLIEFEWSKVLDEVFVPHLGAATLQGQKWSTCPCLFCTSQDTDGFCLTPV
jgi:hypothetical protein